MAKTSRSQFQIDVSPAVRNRAKAVAYGRGLKLTEFILLAFAKMGDEDLTRLVKQDLENRAERGRPVKEK
jgi:hypothetical protein